MVVVACRPLPCMFSTIGSRTALYFTPNRCSGSISKASSFCTSFGTCDSTCGTSGARDVVTGMTIVDCCGGGTEEDANDGRATGWGACEQAASNRAGAMTNAQ